VDPPLFDPFMKITEQEKWQLDNAFATIWSLMSIRVLFIQHSKILINIKSYMDHKRIALIGDVGGTNIRLQLISIDLNLNNPTQVLK